jgi:hypothetical protein
MSSSAVAQQAVSAAGYDPAGPDDLVQPRRDSGGRTATDPALRDADTHCQRHRLAVRRPPKIDIRINRVGFLCTTRLSRGRL